MKPKPNSKRPESEYRDMMYKNGTITERVITRVQMMELDPTETDLYRNEATAETVIQPAKGRPIRHRGSIPGIGHTTWKLLEELMWAAGEYLTVGRINGGTKDPSFEMAWNVQSHVRHIRKALGESAKKTYFIWTTDSPEYAICWQKDRSWRIIERLAQAPGDSGSEQ